MNKVIKDLKKRNNYENCSNKSIIIPSVNQKKKTGSMVKKKKDLNIRNPLLP
jgi:hypothetical protein